MRLASTVAAALVALAAPVAAPAAPVSATVTPLSAPTPLPVAFPAAPQLFGHPVPAGQPIPAGSTVLAVDFIAVAGQDGELTVSCPSGATAIDVAPADPSLRIGFDGPVGGSAPLRVVDAPASGPERVYVLCLPVATGSQVVSHRTRAPVRFPRAAGARTDTPPLAKGARLPAGSRLLVTRLTGLTDGVAAVTSVRCGNRRTPTLSATSSAGVSAVVVTPDLVALQTPTGLTPGQVVTLYTLCTRARNV